MGNKESSRIKTAGLAKRLMKAFAISDKAANQNLILETHSKRREPTLENCLLTNSCALWHALHSCAHTLHTHTKIKKVKCYLGFCFRKLDIVATVAR